MGWPVLTAKHVVASGQDCQLHPSQHFGSNGHEANCKTPPPPPPPPLSISRRGYLRPPDYVRADENLEMSERDGDDPVTATAASLPRALTLNEGSLSPTIKLRMRSQAPFTQQITSYMTTASSTAQYLRSARHRCGGTHQG